MQYRTLGRTGFRVSLVSLGTGGPSVAAPGDPRAALRRCASLHSAETALRRQVGDGEAEVGYAEATRSAAGVADGRRAKRRRDQHGRGAREIKRAGASQTANGG